MAAGSARPRRPSMPQQEPQPQGVATTRRRLRIELRRLREAADLQQAEVAKRLDWSASKLIRIENGSVGLSVTDPRALIAPSDVPDGDVDPIVKMAPDSLAS